MTTKDYIELGLALVVAGLTVLGAFFATLGWLHRDLLSRIKNGNRSINKQVDTQFHAVREDIKAINQKVNHLLFILNDVQSTEDLKVILEILAKNSKANKIEAGLVKDDVNEKENVS